MEHFILHVLASILATIVGALVIIHNQNRNASNAKRIEDITHVRQDLCVQHYPFEKSMPLLDTSLLQKCKNTKFANPDNANIINKHNNGTICLTACLMHYEERQRALANLLDKTGPALQQVLGDVRWFLAFGALLGHFRGDGLMPWDPDLDICVEAGPLMKIANKFGDQEALLVTPTIVVRRKIGDWIPLVIEDRSTGLYVDVFPWHDDGDTVRTADQPGTFKTFQVSEILPLRTENVQGVTVPVPNNVEAAVKKWYGTNFMTKPYRKTQWGWEKT